MEKSSTQLLTPKDVENEFKISIGTQAVWRCTNRYSWKKIAIKIGSKVAYRRGDVEKWLESRKG